MKKIQSIIAASILMLSAFSNAAELSNGKWENNIENIVKVNEESVLERELKLEEDISRFNYSIESISFNSDIVKGKVYTEVLAFNEIKESDQKILSELDSEYDRGDYEYEVYDLSEDTSSILWRYGDSRIKTLNNQILQEIMFKDITAEEKGKELLELEIVFEKINKTFFKHITSITNGLHSTVGREISRGMEIREKTTSFLRLDIYVKEGQEIKYMFYGAIDNNN